MAKTPAFDNPAARPLELGSGELQALFDACVEFVLQHLESLPRQPSWDVEDAAAVAAGFEEAAPESGRSIEEILRRLGPAVSKSFNTAGPGYLAFIPGGGLPSAAIADFIACAVNRFVAVAAAAPALARIEATAIAWIAAQIGYPATSGGVLTSGGSISNLTAIATARIDRLPEDFRDGRLYLSEQSHLSLVKAARVAGLSERQIRWVPVDSRLRLVPDRLRAMMQEDRGHGLRPFLVIANVGTTNTGAIDPLPEIAAIAREHAAWVHADAAYGGFFRLVPGGERLMPGLETADSITLDPHKGMFLPYGTGCLLVRDPAPLKEAHRGEATYLQDVRGGAIAPDFHALSPELSRDFRGLRVWLPIMLHGWQAFRDQLGEKLELARQAWEALRGEALVEMIDAPQLSVVAFTCKPAGGRDGNAVAAELLRRVNLRRRVFLSSTMIGGRFVVRLCVLSFRTHAEQMALAVDAIREELKGLAG